MPRLTLLPVTVQGNAEVVTITTVLPEVIARVEIVSASIATPTIDNLSFRKASVPIGTSDCAAAPPPSADVAIQFNEERVPNPRTRATRPKERVAPEFQSPPTSSAMDASRLEKRSIAPWN